MLFTRPDPAYRRILLDFRADMFRHLTVITAAFCATAAYALLFVDPLPHPLVALLFIICGFSFSIRGLAQARPNAARYLFVMVLFGGLCVAMLLFPEAWLPFLALPLLLLSGLLMSYANLLLAAVFFGYTLLLTALGHGDYPLQPLAFLLTFMVFISSTAIQTFNTALMWYSSMLKRTDDLLQETRNRRAELMQTLKSLENAYEAQRRLQHQLAYARKQAEEARRLKERFASNISHELRTPLNIILGFTEIMYLTPEVYGDIRFPPKLHRDIYQIHRNSRHLLEMIDDVLDLSHIEMSQFSLNFELTDLNQFLTDTAEMVSNLFRGKPLAFIVDIADNLPTIEIDRTRIRQVIINLLNNAQRFTERGSVTFRAYQQDNEVVFSVIDTGKGIPQDKLPLIFEEFYQVDYSLSRSHGGAGLGLSITKRFVEAHNGTIRVESVEGEGSTFTFTLPIPPKFQLQSRGQWLEDEPPERVWLVVDSDPRVPKLIQRYVKNCHVIQVNDEAAVCDAVQAHSPRGVIFNRAPERDLPPTCQDVPVPVVMCSLPSTTRLIRQLGVDSCLAKPVHPRQIAEELERYPNLERLLVVDDDLGVVQLVQRSVETYLPEVEVFRAYDGHHALDLMRQHKPDVMLLDLAMPGLSGQEVLDTMRNDPNLPDIPVILLTATQYIYGEQDFYTSMEIRQPDGLRPMEVLKLLDPIMNALEPH